MHKMLFVISKGFEKAGSATRAMQFAALAAKKEETPVQVALIDDAIHWAQLGMAEGIRTTTGEHMKDMVDELIAAKGDILVCKACADKRLVGPDELIEGSRIAGAQEIVDLMCDDAMKVVTF
ncbi:DsrE family protein [Desulfovermiculus halophilus]|uniref:DsrE family protein n=1 Tax=Desulfovermiculus halophilus TaxID=339722 RepID=UPI000485B3E5|nr:DsrE family protein [Desulfovermiculus halophilus]